NDRGRIYRRVDLHRCTRGSCQGLPGWLRAAALASEPEVFRRQHYEHGYLVRSDDALGWAGKVSHGGLAERCPTSALSRPAPPNPRDPSSYPHPPPARTTRAHGHHSTP